MINLIEEFLRSALWVAAWLTIIVGFIGWIRMVLALGERRGFRLGIFLWSAAAAGLLVGKDSGWESIILTGVLALFIGLPYSLYKYLLMHKDPEDVL